jgi:succinate dehydrogenase / fumarate reductase flavoprotein subunit/L-aspartate oxidase
MPYTEELKNRIKAVEKTRTERVARKRQGKEFPTMSLEEREEILKKFHPDCKEAEGAESGGQQGI